MNSTEIANLLFEEPLYLEHRGEKPAIREMALSLHAFTGAVDHYCPECKLQSTFRGQVAEDHLQYIRNLLGLAPPAAVRKGVTDPYAFLDNDFSVVLGCTRANHRAFFYFRRRDEASSLLQKVGQSPSIVDFAMGQLAQFKAA